MKKFFPYIFIVLELLLFTIIIILAINIRDLSKKRVDGIQTNMSLLPVRLKAVDNQLIMKNNGKALRLKGFVTNYFRHGEPSETTLNKLLLLIDKVKELGGNTIDFYYNPDKMNKRTILLMDKAVDYAGNQGLYVIVEPVVLKEDMMSGRVDHSIRYIAERYETKPYVIVGIWAEPYYTTGNEWWPKLVKLVKMVREVNPDTLIVIPGAGFSREFGFLRSKELPDKNIILSTHEYHAENRFKYNGDLKFDIEDTNLKDLNKTIPVMYGEFGGFWGGDFSSPQDLEIITKQLEKIDEYKLSAMGYALDETGGLEILDNQGNPTSRGKIFKNNYIRGL